MTQKNALSNTELICRTFDQRRHQDADLFTESATPCYWQLSDLVRLYPNCFDMNSVRPYSLKTQIQSAIFTKIPKFKELYPEPIHVLTVTEPYVLYDKNTGDTKLVKNQPNQHLTGLACEFLFSQIKGAEIQQAFFLLPNAQPTEILDTAKEIRFEHVRNQTIEFSNTLASLINHSYNVSKDSFRTIWTVIWNAFFNMNNINALRKQYGMTSSPINYMTLEGLTRVNSMLQEILIKCQKYPNINVNTISMIAGTVAKNARCGIRPELLLTHQNSQNRVKQMQKVRETFWKKHYPESLQQR